MRGLAFTARRLWGRFPAQFNGELRRDPNHGSRALVAVQMLLANRTREEVARLDEALRTGNKAILEALDEAAGRLRDRLKRLEEKHDAHVRVEAEHFETLAQQNRDTHKQLKALTPRLRSAVTDNLSGAGAQPNLAFEGRVAELQQLAELINDPKGPQVIVIVGEAGFGKSDLARQFINRLARPAPPGSCTATLATDEWTGPWWLDGSCGGEEASLKRWYEVITGKEYWSESGQYGHRNVAWTRCGLGTHLWSSGRGKEAVAMFEEAERRARDSITLIEAAGNALRFAHQNAISVLGESLHCQLRFAEAEPLTTAPANALRNMPEAGAAAIREATARVVRLYRVWNAAQPGQGHDKNQALWHERLTAFDVEVGYARPGEL